MRAVAAQDREGRQGRGGEGQQRAGRDLAAAHTGRAGGDLAAAHTGRAGGDLAAAHTGRARPRERRGGRRRAAAARAQPVERDVDDGAQPAAEVGDVEARALATQAARVDAQRVEGQDGLGQRLGLGRVEEDAGLAVDHRLAHAALVQGDDRPAGGLGLDGGDPELLGRGDDERARARQEARRLGIADAAGEAHRRPGHPLQAARVGAVADDQQRQAQLVERPHRDVDALVRHQLGEHDVGVARRRPA